jgi:hypothetical protein
MKNANLINQINPSDNISGLIDQNYQNAEHNALEDFFDLYVKVIDEVQGFSVAAPMNIRSTPQFSPEESLFIAISG